MPGLIRADGGLEVLGRSLGLSTAALPGRCSICVRPERVEPGTGSGAISGTVVHLENLGAEAFVHVKVDRSTCRWSRGVNPDRQLPAIGSAIDFAFPASAIRVFDAAGKRIEAAVPVRSERVREKALG